MTIDELREEVGIEVELIESVVAEALSLRNDVGEGEPSVREKTAAAAFIAQFYGGLENILKRIHRYHGIPTPVGDAWHIEIFKRFSPPGYPGLPILFDDSLSRSPSPYRKFRHVVYHGYGFQLEWERMK
ncbi:MAG: hypothetical protein IBX46_12200 [Desulfuromonadales bacterium]|nr:hypothetical protein [Desulfuromonadales bacterium]